jgi:hypothetical protein
MIVFGCEVDISMPSYFGCICLIKKAHTNVKWMTGKVRLSGPVSG